MIDPDMRAKLLAAWLAWDDRPADQQRAEKMVEMCGVVAERLNISPSKFRDLLNELRRKMFQHDEVLDLVVSRLTRENEG